MICLAVEGICQEAGNDGWIRGCARASRSTAIRRSMSGSRAAPCSEFRHSQIGDWMKRRGDLPWRKGKPPEYRR